MTVSERPGAYAITAGAGGELVHVRTGEYAISEHPDVLLTLALGSCVGVALWDSRRRRGGLAHVMLPTPGNREAGGSLDRFASHALPAMAAELTQGVSGVSLVAKVVGGASMFRSEPARESIGDRNLAEVRRQLALLRIPIVAEDSGGSCARTAALYLDSGTVVVRGYACGVREL